MMNSNRPEHILNKVYDMMNYNNVFLADFATLCMLCKPSVSVCLGSVSGYCVPGVQKPAAAHEERPG